MALFFDPTNQSTVILFDATAMFDVTVTRRAVTHPDVIFPDDVHPGSACLTD